MSMEQLPPELRRPRGVVGRFFIVLAGVGLGGAALDYLSQPTDPFWIGERFGGRAAIGVSVAILAIAGAHMARRLLARKESDETSEGGDVNRA